MRGGERPPLRDHPEVLGRDSDGLSTCGGPVRKLISSPAIQFKGSGFYITDYARKSGTDAGKESKGSPTSSSSSDSGSGSASSGSSSSSSSGSSSSSSTPAAASTPSKKD